MQHSIKVQVDCPEIFRIEKYSKQETAESY